MERLPAGEFLTKDDTLAFRSAIVRYSKTNDGRMDVSSIGAKHTQLWVRSEQSMPDVPRQAGRGIASGIETSWTYLDPQFKGRDWASRDIDRVAMSSFRRISYAASRIGSKIRGVRERFGQ